MSLNATFGLYADKAELGAEHSENFLKFLTDKTFDWEIGDIISGTQDESAIKDITTDLLRMLRCGGTECMDKYINEFLAFTDESGKSMLKIITEQQGSLESHHIKDMFVNVLLFLVFVVYLYLSYLYSSVYFCFLLFYTNLGSCVSLDSF